jgi:ribosome-associated toxin RatA of RatAB toxin-antitoxin module
LAQTIEERTVSHRIEATGDIDAPQQLVYQVVADVARYPEFVPGVKEVTQEGDTVRMTVRMGPIDVSWTSRAVFEPYTSIDITLVDGPFEQMDVRWEFVAREDVTEVTNITDYELILPIPGIEGMAARAIEANAGATIRAFRQRIRLLQSERRR